MNLHFHSPSRTSLCTFSKGTDSNYSNSKTSSLNFCLDVLHCVGLYCINYTRKIDNSAMECRNSEQFMLHINCIWDTSYLLWVIYFGIKGVEECQFNRKTTVCFYHFLILCFLLQNASPSSILSLFLMDLTVFLNGKMSPTFWNEYCKIWV